MTTHTRDSLPEGLEDRLPQATAAATRVTRAIMDVMDAHGYDRVQPPQIEFEASLASRMAARSTGCAATGWYTTTPSRRLTAYC